MLAEAHRVGDCFVGLKPSSQRHAKSKRISYRLGAKRAAVWIKVEELEFIREAMRLLRFARNDME
ncbi:MAG TPA: hypothetical protein PLM89_04415 [Anaerolineales bacterium]|nr:hypothetical protein [Anaerolineales bacterium]